jgi:hypothetical protein
MIIKYRVYFQKAIELIDNLIIILTNSFNL